MKKIIIISSLILASIVLANTAQAGLFRDFFNNLFPQEKKVDEDINLGITPQVLPLMAATSTDQYGNTINAVEVKGNKDLYIDANASTTGSVAFEGYKTGSTVCLQIDANGSLEVAVAACGTGAGGAVGMLSEIGDVSTTTLDYGHLLMYDGTNWQDTATSSLGITVTELDPVWVAASGNYVSYIGAMTGDLNFGSYGFNAAYGTTTNATSTRLVITESLSVAGGILDFDADTIEETDINFATSCGTGNHLYVLGGNLACEDSFTGKTTANLSENTNLYYTQARVWDDTWASTTEATILTNAQTAYGWGDHSGQGYTTSTIDGNFRVDGNATTTGSMYITNDLTVAGDTTLIDVIITNYQVSGNSTTTGYISAGTDDGNFNFTAGDINASGELYVGENGTITGGLTVLNATTTNHFAADSTLYVRHGNVGIGTTSPDTKLQVVGDIGISNTDSFVSRNSVGDGWIDLLTVDSSNLLTVGSTNIGGTITFNSGYTDVPLTMVGNPGTGGGLHIINGNVGIGTTSPKVKFVVADSASTHILVDASGSGKHASIRLSKSDTSGGSRVDFRTADVTDWVVGTSDSTDFGDGTEFFIGTSATAPKLTIATDGNVGIGTTSPSNKLHVGSGASSFQVTNNGDVRIVSDNSADPLLKITGSGSADLINVIDGSTEVFTILDGGNIGIGLTGPTALLEVQRGSGGTETLLQVGTSTDSDILVVKSNGNVGIGTTGPSQKLSVAGNVLADDYLEYSPAFVGDAITAIKGIKAEKDTEQGDWAKIDHNTLPEGVKVENQATSISQVGIEIIEHEAEYEDVFNEKTGTSTVLVKEEWIEEKPIMEETEYTFIGRSLGGSVQLNLRAIQQLIERVETLEAEKAVSFGGDRITELEARIIELENRMGIIERFINWIKSIF